MTWLKPLIYLALFVSFEVVWAGNPAFNRRPLLDVATIEGWINDPVETPKSVGDLLLRFPALYRSHFVLMHDSLSLHQATPTHPRIIFFGPDARLLTAVSTFPEDPRRDIIELIQFEPQTAKYSFHEVSFIGKSPQIVHEPPKCKSCHGVDGRPNWEPYDMWPGSYGSVHDTIPSGALEHNFFTEFLLNFKKNDRLQSLQGDFFMKDEGSAGKTNYFTVSRGSSSNASLSILLGFSNRERLARQIINSKDHSQYRYAIIAALLGCPQEPREFLRKDLKLNHPKIFTEVLDETQKLIHQGHLRRLHLSEEFQKTSPNNDISERVDRFGLRQKEIVRIAKLRYLLENRTVDKLEMDRWSLSHRKDTYDLNDGLSGLENLVGHYVPMAFSPSESITSKIIYETIPFAITSYDSDAIPSNKEKEVFALQAFEAPSPSKELCEELAINGKAELTWKR